MRTRSFVTTNQSGPAPNIPPKQDAQLPDPQLPDPQQVLDDPSLSRDEKIEKLRRWSYDAREIDVANEEGMGGKPRPSNLDAVQKALRELGAVDSPTSHKQ